MSSFISHMCCKYLFLLCGLQFHTPDVNLVNTKVNFYVVKLIDLPFWLRNDGRRVAST